MWATSFNVKIYDAIYAPEQANLHGRVNAMKLKVISHLHLLVIFLSQLHEHRLQLARKLQQRVRHLIC